MGLGGGGPRSHHHVVVGGGSGSCGGGSSPTMMGETGEIVVNGRPSPISNSNTIVDLSSVNDATPTGAAPLAGAPPLAVAIAPALPGARRLKESSGSSALALNISANQLPSNQRERI